MKKVNLDELIEILLNESRAGDELTKACEKSLNFRKEVLAELIEIGMDKDIALQVIEDKFGIERRIKQIMDIRQESMEEHQKMVSLLQSQATVFNLKQFDRDVQTVRRFVRQRAKEIEKRLRGE